MNAPTIKPLWELYATQVSALKEERYKQLYLMMDREGLDALVVLATATLGRKGNLRFISNYSPISRYGGVIFPRQSDPVLLVPYAVHAYWAETTSWIEDVRTCQDFASEVASILLDAGCERGRIGLAGEESVPGFAKSLSTFLAGTELTTATPALTSLRMNTGEEDLKLVRHAASMADQVFEEAATLIGAGAAESEIFAAAEARLRRLHAEDSLLLIDSTGQQVSPFPTARIIAEGDVVQYSVEPVSPGGQWIQSVRMFSRGRPHRTVQNVVQTCIGALAVAQAELCPGVRIARVASAIAEILEPIAPQGRIPYGHGIGLDNFEAPLLSVESDEMVKDNMLVVIHPALVVEGRSFYLGDTFLVTESGAERLSTYPLEMLVV